MNFFLNLFFFINIVSLSFALEKKEYSTLANILINNQINKETVLKLIKEINMVQNKEVIEIDGEFILFKYSEEITQLIDNIGLFVIGYYKKNKKVLSQSIEKNLEDKNFKIRLAKELCETIILQMK